MAMEEIRSSTALRSFEALAASFSQNVFPSLNTPSGNPVCWSKDGTTTFFLGTGSYGYSDTCIGSDWVVICILFAVLHTISWSIRWVVWEPFYTWHKSTRHSKVPRTKEMTNFSRTLTSCLFHSASLYFGYKLLAGEDWLYDRTQWFRVQTSIKPDFKFYYLIYAAWYVSDSVSFFFENKRSDTFVYAIHHVATIGLVLMSAHTGYSFAGGVIMFFFDWADPPILLAKACKYLSNDPSDMYQFMADRLFELFAVVFFVTRNVMYSYVVYSAIIDDSEPQSASRFTLRCLLVILALLMKFWLVLLIRAILHKMKNGAIEDIREDDCRTHKKVS